MHMLIQMCSYSATHAWAQRKAWNEGKSPLSVNGSYKFRRSQRSQTHDVWAFFLLPGGYQHTNTQRHPGRSAICTVQSRKLKLTGLSRTPVNSLSQFLTLSILHPFPQAQHKTTFSLCFLDTWEGDSWAELIQPASCSHAHITPYLIVADANGRNHHSEYRRPDSVVT